MGCYLMILRGTERFGENSFLDQNKAAAGGFTISTFSNQGQFSGRLALFKEALV